MIDPHIFRAYDIRGKAHSQISAEACRLIGHAFGTVLRRRYKKERPEVVVGRDARTHGPDLEKAVIDGLVAAGCKVLLIGPTPSPLNYFTICDKKLDGGIQVTASHNPKDDNGLKLQTRDAEAYSGDDLQTLRMQIEKKDFENGKGSTEKYDAVPAYRAFLKKLFGDVGAGKKVVVDSGNGITGPVNCQVLRDLGAEVIELFTEPDGEFPNHPADPSKHETLIDLQEEVAEWKADVGFGFDGDGDRLGLVDEKATIRTADETILLLAREHLEKHPGSPVIFTVSNSGILETEIKKWGGKPVMCKVGHSYVEHAMREHGAKLGGEQSGHYFYGDGYYGFDDALVAALAVLKTLSHRAPKTLSQLMEDFPKVYQAPELRPHCPDDAKAKVIESVTAHFAKTHKVITLDGVRIDFGDGAWAGIRQSNTSPCISICMEARSPQKLEQLKTAVLGHLQSYPEIDL
jgi:phosphomannomutase/phosphoglucomutase